MFVALRFDRFARELSNHRSSFDRNSFHSANRQIDRGMFDWNSNSDEDCSCPSCSNCERSDCCDFNVGLFG